MRWLALLMFVGCGGAGDDGEQPSGEPVATEVGTPVGAPSSATIGPEGGTLISSDGEATLIVPPDAIATPTEITIQQITNHAHTSPGGAYRLTPDGTVFATPVQLELAYHPETLLDTSPGLLAIAYQNTDGFWAVLAAPEVDTAQQRVRVALSHFTDYATVEGARVVVVDDMLETQDATQIRLQLCFDVDNTAEPLMVPCLDAATSLSGVGVVEFDEARINGVLDGDLINGSITRSASSGVWDYLAPRKVPAANPVAFSVPVLSYARERELLVANITILGGDVWAGTAETRNEYTGPATGFSNLTITRANVTWTFDEALGAHIPSGTVEYTETGMYDHSPGPPCVVSASYTGPISSFSSSLQIDSGSYAGIGVELGVIVNRTDSCEGTQAVPLQLGWMPSSQGDIEEDNITIDREETKPAGADTTQTVKYHFVKQL